MSLIRITIGPVFARISTDCLELGMGLKFKQVLHKELKFFSEKIKEEEKVKEK